MNNARFLLIALCAGLLASALSVWPVAAQSTRRLERVQGEGRRLALVIGNDKYPSMPLANATNDASAMAASLRRLGFDVQYASDTTFKTMSQAVDRFVATLRNGDVALAYYAGHGIQVDGDNYLLPIDFDAKDETDAKYESYSATRLVERMSAAGAELSVLVLDACRDNPFRSTRSTTRGLAPMNGATGSLIAFATAPGRTAADGGRSANGLFTSHLLKVIEQPNLTIEQVFSRVRQDVYEASNGQQVPWSVSSVVGDFYFMNRPPTPVIAPPPPANVPSPAPASAATPPSVPAVSPAAATAENSLSTATLAAVERACRSGNAQACYESGERRIRVSLGGDAAPVADSWIEARRAQDEMAELYYRLACEGGVADGCASLGFIVEASPGDNTRFEKARALYQRACDSGSADGCRNLGWAYDWGLGMASNEVQAASFYQRACDADSALACTNLGALYEKRGEASRALPLYQRACDKGDIYGCLNLSGLYEKGRGVSLDLARAASLFDKACGATGLACENLPLLRPKLPLSPPASLAHDVVKVLPAGFEFNVRLMQPLSSDELRSRIGVSFAIDGDLTVGPFPIVGSGMTYEALVTGHVRSDRLGGGFTTTGGYLYIADRRYTVGAIVTKVTDPNGVAIQGVVLDSTSSTISNSQRRPLVLPRGTRLRLRLVRECANCDQDAPFWIRQLPAN